jgi:hypothetical protein
MEDRELVGMLSCELPKRPGRIAGIFMRRGLWAKLEFIFWRTLCPMPDQTRLGMWWYGVSGRIARYFHAKHCSRCARAAAAIGKEG